SSRLGVQDPRRYHLGAFLCRQTLDDILQIRRAHGWSIARQKFRFPSLQLALCGFEHRSQFVLLTEETKVFLQELRLDLQLTSNPFPSLAKPANQHVTTQRDTNTHHHTHNKA